MRKCWQDISCGGNFHDATSISFIKAYWFYFRVGVIFAKNIKMGKLPPCENVYVYSIQLFHGSVENSVTIVMRWWRMSGKLLPKAEGFRFDNTYCIQKIFPPVLFSPISPSNLRAN